MAKKGKLNRRPPVVREMVINGIRSSIVAGDYGPGDRLPTRLELCERFKTGEPTLQVAMRELIEEGFVETRGAAGTFVAQRPPHLFRYGIAFMESPSRSGWTRFYADLSNAAAKQGLEQYFNVASFVDASVSDRSRFIEDLATRRLAGVIFTTSPSHFVKLSLLKDIPHVAFSNWGRDSSTVDVDYRSLTDLALDHLAASGRSKIAVLHAQDGLPPDMQGYLGAALDERGMATTRTNCLGLPRTPSDTIRRVVHLMFAPDRSSRPDGLFVVDDNLLEPASLGLLDAGISAKELTLVSHANFPDPTVSHFPVKRFGFDVRKVLERCMAFLQEQREEGEAPIERFLVPAQVEPVAELAAY